MYNLRDRATQVALDTIPGIAMNHAEESMQKQWATMDFPEDTVCPYKPLSKATMMIVSIREGKLVGWTCVCNLSMGIWVRVKWVNGKIECTDNEIMSSHFITCVQRLGTSRLLKRFNNKWQNADY